MNKVVEENKICNATAGVHGFARVTSTTFEFKAKTQMFQMGTLTNMFLDIFCPSHRAIYEQLAHAYFSSKVMQCVSLILNAF